MSDRPDANEYEFSASENRVIGDLSWKMHYVGMFLVAVAGLTTVYALFDLVDRIGNLVAALIYFAIGWYTINAAASFRQIVETEGRDIGALMDACRNLLKLYRIQFWLVILALLLLVVAVIVGLVAFVREAPLAELAIVPRTASL
jgi:hypothetical protein